MVGLQRKRGVGVEVRRVEREGCTCGFGKGQAEGGRYIQCKNLWKKNDG